MKPKQPLRRTRLRGGPDPIDVQVGQRLRQARLLANHSQATLSEAVGLSFQAMQKYEAGDVRLSASRLYAIAKVLGQTISFFFEEVEPDAVKTSSSIGLNNKEIELIRSLRLISDTRARESIIELIKQTGALSAERKQDNGRKSA